MVLPRASRLSWLQTPTPAPPGTRIAQWIVPYRVAIGRKEDSGKGDGLVELHLSGSAADFGNSLPRASNLGFDVVPASKTFPSPTPSLRISLSQGVASNPSTILSVAEQAEKLLHATPTLSSEALLDSLQNPDYLRMILEDPLLSVGKQIGLVGELQFLEKLIDRADATGVPRVKAFSAWKNGARDFANNGIVVEAKTSGGKTRKHLISDYKQLVIRGAERELYVMSASAAPDSSGARKLPEHVDHLLTKLSASEQTTLLNRLRTWWRGGTGYDHGTRGAYIGEPPLSVIFTPALFAISPPSSTPVDPLVPASFVRVLPNVEEIQYRLNLEALAPISTTDFEAVLDSLLT
jgi:hypothetical protein